MKNDNKNIRGGERDRVKDKVAIVTGGSSGIGKAASILLAKEGAKVAIVDINTDESAVAMIKKGKGTAEFWYMDVTNEEEIAKVFSEIESKFGGINILVNNAGISGANKPTHKLTLEEWQEVININQNGVFLCTKHVIPYMFKAKKGSIINISSIYGIVGGIIGWSDSPPYHASKGAVRIMTKTDAMLYAKDNIRVNSIYPGFIWTTMLENYAKQLTAGVEATKQSLGALHPIGHK